MIKVIQGKRAQTKSYCPAEVKSPVSGKYSQAVEARPFECKTLSVKKITIETAKTIRPSVVNVIPERHSEYRGDLTMSVTLQDLFSE